ncbi:glutamate synthase-related protein [Candidatus Haliotispira prima]|uniref:Glutamate synthase-related protein n=1 Tax=Candidatus Haliotispira prima TaxID=3034016 RepID=A0ABY8MJ38_9SPIO|nr:glutamate synthase-related protein [Candidatus Haliotispira prima]
MKNSPSHPNAQSVQNIPPGAKQVKNTPNHNKNKISFSESGLYRRRYEHDACGVGLVAQIDGSAKHEIVQQGLEILHRMEHRGAIGGDGSTGDGAGISLQLHHDFVSDIFPQLADHSDESYAVAMLFLAPGRLAELQQLTEHEIARMGSRKDHTVAEPDRTSLPGIEFVGWREVPVVADAVGKLASGSMPAICQLAVRFDPLSNWRERDAKIYFLRRKIELAAREHGLEPEDFYFCSFSSSLIVYKGMFTAPQLGAFYPDLQNPKLCSAYALVHQRYSTNTLPQWYLAHPFRHLAHNGEINTIEHNLRSFTIRESDFDSPVFGPHVRELTPTMPEGCSDSAGFDGALEALLHNGRSLAHVLSMMVPEPFGAGTDLSQDVKDYYHYQSMLMEPWDGPAAIVATTGREITAILDRNGLRPARFTVTKDGRLILASEAGVLHLAPENIARQGKLSPGKLLSLDLERGRLSFDRELKRELAAAQPYGQWLAKKPELGQLPEAEALQQQLIAPDKAAQQLLAKQLRNFGYSYEDLRDILAPMAEDGIEPTGSMASPLALAGLVRSNKENPGESLSSYFRQTFAQVTNPPIDPYRETAVMSLSGFLGAQGNLLCEGKEHSQMLELEHPIFGPTDLEKLEELVRDEKGFVLRRISLLLTPPDSTADRRPASRGQDQGDPREEGQCLQTALQRICDEAETAAKEIATPNRTQSSTGTGPVERETEKHIDSTVQDGCVILLLSDCGVSSEHTAVPALLALGAVQQSLVQSRLRGRVSLGVEGGELFSIQHFATLTAYGANFIVPYMAYRAIGELGRRKLLQNNDLNVAIRHYIEAGKKGLLKVMSKMGVSTMQSYQNSRLYEILGLGSEIVERCFPGTPNPIQGKGFAEIEREIRRRHAAAWMPGNLAKSNLRFNGSLRLRRNLKLHNIPSSFPAPALQHRPTTDRATYGADSSSENDGKEDENLLLTPISIMYLQQAVRNNDYATFRKYSEEVNRAGKHSTLRGQLHIRSDQKPISKEQVEGAESILSRFVSGAMSYGSLSKEAHEAIAIAMNRIGARSNSGEGGEDPVRYSLLPNGDDRRSRIKQVASGRFGVNSYYLANADELQIKMAQGAKPGEGGQLPGKKVDKEIARVRNSTPGVTLISPPPHHDIYSIEDLAQLIYDLRSANPVANISVKLVAKSGVGTVAAGVAKGKADSILISGHDGGTGASPLSSLMHAGSYWELGLAETQQSLRRNRLRDQVRIQCDGQLKTGRDVLIAGLLGAEEFGFGTSCLVALGCIMMRKCHTNSCPVGIATQDKRCRERFAGLPDHVENMMRFIAEELRELMAEMGYSRLEQLIGRADLLKPDHSNLVLRDNHIDLQPMLESVDNEADRDLPRHALRSPDISDPYTMEPELLRLCREALGEKFEKPGREGWKPFRHECSIDNSHRTVGTTISYHISKNRGMAGLPDKSIHLKFCGSAGQSFGAFGAHGLQLELEGESNDYFGKGLSGARLILYPFRNQYQPNPQEDERLNPQEHGLIVGNVCLFGATSGNAYIAGQAGERFAVRNSGATAVVEGLGAHGCEYMTGGRVVVLGLTGLNFAAGMSGGIAYVWDCDNKFRSRCNLQQTELSGLAEHPEELLWLEQRLRQHLQYTGSLVARDLLDNWTIRQEQFVRVIPSEYRLILEQLAATQRLPAQPSTQDQDREISA